MNLCCETGYIYRAYGSREGVKFRNIDFDDNVLEIGSCGERLESIRFRDHEARASTGVIVIWVEMVVPK